MRRVCIYCGSAQSVRDVYLKAAAELGRSLARLRKTVVYGGGSIGLMGAMADGALAAGGEVIGIIPEKLHDGEVGHAGLSELIVVEGMHARKSLMMHLSDAIIALPGGWGTLEELFEITAWRQLRLHHKPIGLLNVDGYYDGLLRFLDQATNEGFAHPSHDKMFHTNTTVQGLLSDLGIGL